MLYVRRIGRDPVSVQTSGPRDAIAASVSDTVTATIGHNLGKIEAVRRLKEGLARTNGHLGAAIAVEQETWQGDTLHFRIRALGQTAAAGGNTTVCTVKGRTVTCTCRNTLNLRTMSSLDSMR